MPKLISSLPRWMPLFALMCLVLVPAQAEPRNARAARVDAASQTRQPQATDSKLGAYKALPQAKARQSECAGGDCSSKCSGPQCAKSSLFGALMDLFDGHPGCTPRASDNLGDNDVPTLDRPPKLI
ncbi:hypothetical protein [Chitinimonas sp. BJYL2]|uniref:hypothetical protein n=1 Tax=Chitinimonas sp. BJYL2 TaxID=2976696 RepID=UPI0022B32F0C|nr:hypothetical protein [Chitinimonas sp. BJYL2]